MSRNISDSEEEEDAYLSADEGLEDEVTDENHVSVADELEDIKTDFEVVTCAVADISTNGIESSVWPEFGDAKFEVSNKKENFVEEKDVDDVPRKSVEEDEVSGWDIEDWGDFSEETMVTPDTGLPPATPSWATVSNIGTSNSDKKEPAVGGEQRPSNLWGGFNSLLSAATSFTSTVGEGFTNVLETVETTLGAPTPEDLARLTLAERAELRKKADEVKEPWPQEDRDDCDSAEEIMSDGGSDAGAGHSEEGSSGYQSDSGRFREIDSSRQQRVRPSGITGLISGVTTAFESTSKTLVSGSLDVLETLGKKTFDTLTETDKDTQRKRFILTTEKPNLSVILRELKEKGEANAKLLEEEQEARFSNYAFLFDKYQGMINLEALEMLSENCSRQLEVMVKSPKSTDELFDCLEAVRRLFEDPEDISLSFSEDEEENEQDFESLLGKQIQRLNVTVNTYKVSEVQRKRVKWIDECIRDQSLGETKKRKDDAEDPDSLNRLLTNLFLEANNSCSYVREAFRLLRPVVQLTTARILLETNE